MPHHRKGAPKRSRSNKVSQNDVIVKTLADLIQFYKNEINPNLDFGEAYIEHYTLVIAGKFDKFTKEYKF